MPPEDRDGYRKVRAEVPIPIAGGECEFTRYGFRDFIGGGCVDIVQPDIAACGGLTAFTQILTLANTHGVATVPHVWGSGVAVTAALHAVAVIPAFPHTANPTPLLNQPVIEFGFSRTMGRSVRLPIADLHRIAGVLGADRPATRNGTLDWQRVMEARAARDC